MRGFLVVILVLLSAFGVSCSSTKTTAIEQLDSAQSPKEVKEKTVTKQTETAVSADIYPVWVFNPSSLDDATYKYFSGSSEITVSDKMARQQAMSNAAGNAANALALSVQTAVQTTEKTSVDSTGESQYTASFEKEALAKSATIVAGLEMVNQWKDPDTGEFWVLMRMPKTIFDSIQNELLEI